MHPIASRPRQLIQASSASAPSPGLLGGSGVTQGLGVPPFGGGESKSPEDVAPTPAPIGIVPEPPKPPDVLTQHSSGLTVLHPITSSTSTRRRGVSEPENERMDEPFGSVIEAERGDRLRVTPMVTPKRTPRSRPRAEQGHP